jgi:hypothetical protein
MLDGFQKGIIDQTVLSVSAGKPMIPNYDVLIVLDDPTKFSLQAIYK